jgi:hypothetical protein
MARWTARRRGKRSTADDEETEERAVKDESEDERELRLDVEVEVEVLLAWEHGGEGEGEGGGENASDKVSLGIGPNRVCCSGVR